MKHTSYQNVSADMALIGISNAPNKINISTVSLVDHYLFTSTDICKLPKNNNNNNNKNFIL